MKKVFIFIFLISIVIGTYFYLNSQKSPNQLLKKSKENEQLKSIEKTNNSGLFTIEEISKHNKKEDCWLLIEGKVYDVTEYIASGFHPGKLAIVQGCGKDATVLFNTRPMGSGTAHSEKARGFLSKFEIGSLSL